MHPDLAWSVAQMQADEQQRRIRQQWLRQQLAQRSLRQRVAFRCGRVLLRCSRWLLRYGQPTTQTQSVTQRVS